MPRPYCGTGAVPPKKRLGESPEECAHHWRLYGKRLVPLRTQEHEHIVGQLLQLARPIGSDYCGQRSGNHARMRDCQKQFRLYGLLPMVKDSTDVQFKTFHTTPLPKWTNIPSTDQHEYAARIYNQIGDKKDVLLVVAHSAHLDQEDENDLEKTLDHRGVLGAAFGYFTGTLTFEIVRVFVHLPYRGTELSVWLVKKLRDAAAEVLRERYRQLPNARRQKQAEMQVRIDDAAPCLRLFNNNYANKQRLGERLRKVFADAGFEIRTLPTNRRNQTERTAVYTVASTV